MFKKLCLLPSLLMGALFIIGCGGGGSGSTGLGTTSSSIEGVVADGLIQGATVWLDQDGDLELSSGEPFTITSSDGSYLLTFTGGVNIGTKVLSTGGIDQDSGEAFEGVMEAVIESFVPLGGKHKQMITPLLTLKANGLSEAKIRSIFPGLPAGDLNELHPTENKELHRNNTMAHTLVRQLASTKGASITSRAIFAVYGELTSELQTQSLTVGALNFHHLVRNISSADSQTSQSMAAAIGNSMRHLGGMDLENVDDFIGFSNIQSIVQGEIASAIHNFASNPNGPGRGHLKGFERTDLPGFIHAGIEFRQDHFLEESLENLSTSTAECRAEEFLHPSELDSSLVESSNSKLSVTCIGPYLMVESNGVPTFTVSTGVNTLVERTRRYMIPLVPEEADKVSEIPYLGPIGVSITGLPIYAPNEAEDLGYGDAVLDGILDTCGGHVDPMGTYHFHGRPGCPFDQASDLESSVLGYAFDGYPIVAPFVCLDDTCSVMKKVSGSWQKCIDDSCESVLIKELQSSWSMVNSTQRATWDAHAYVPGSGDLDQCNGMVGKDGKYRYYATDTFPYNLGCYHGKVDRRLNRLSPGWSERESFSQMHGLPRPPHANRFPNFQPEQNH